MLSSVCVRTMQADRGSLTAYILMLNVRNGLMDDDDNIGRMAF